MEKIVLVGRGLIVAIIGWGVSATLFTYTGLSALFPDANTGASPFTTFISLTLAGFTTVIASYVTPNSKE